MATKPQLLIELPKSNKVQVSNIVSCNSAMGSMARNLDMEVPALKAAQKLDFETWAHPLQKKVLHANNQV